MQSMLPFSRLVFVVLSFAVLLFAGCSGGSASTPAGTFTAEQVSGKTFAYSSAGSTGTLAFNADGTWSTTIGTSTFSGTWSITGGKLVCVTTAGGDHTVTYTLLSTTSDSINTSFVEVNPAAPNDPANGTATFAATFTTGQVSGKTFAYSSAGSTGTLVFNADSTWSTTIGTSTFSGTWSISDGKLVCVTSAGGNHTLTYTALVSNDAKAIHTSVVEVNPADPANPTTSTATLTALYTVSGKVSQSNTGWAGVTVALDGDQTQTATTDADGTYHFTVPAGEYRVTPSKGNSAFAPLDNSFAVSGADVGAVDFALAPTMAGPNINKWIQTGSLIYKRARHTATLLQNGKVLVAGGEYFVFLSYTMRASAEIYDPATGAWIQTGSLNYKRSEHTATLLKDGRVLVAGGHNSPSLLIWSTHASAELYDPKTGKWAETASLAYDRYGHTATLLQDGRVLVAGGKDEISTGATAEIYDPKTDKWTQTGSLNHKRYHHTATLLQDGKVLVAGGDSGDFLASAEIYDPATGKWTDTGSLPYTSSQHTATLLQDGRVLVAGGITAAGGLNGGTAHTTSSAETYDPATGKWTQTGSLADPRGQHTATLLQDGKVLVAGGLTYSLSGSAEIYDPATSKWTQTGSLNYKRSAPAATLLDSGLVLVVGGTGDLSERTSTELFFPGL
ncbi:kelch repeat-containing protein [Geomesophilobacter sediminis]|uniref:Carboxypeptidase regulatory-like domain-containing protein n=1 Tax=Geomesophilobacter sediminis TaxID=2798584 RepID=A0A8J7IKQ4_9BACT|nr:kelch repeat-containing protein [Geomesophilobacter sediminis]MBJ6723243.1 carboxypeptidase regulatory-like domain-containing protein [Geomesophilobacter sediminis]